MLNQDHNTHLAAQDNRLALYVASWDGYSDLWPGFFHLLSKHWSDCPFKRYLGVNKLSFERGDLNLVRAEINSPWSTRVKGHLKQIGEKYVLMLLDDWYIKSKVDTASILECIEILERFDGHMMRLVPDPPPNYALASCPKVGLMALGVLNRTNTHATIWRKETLENILHDDEDLWRFEINGAVRSNQYSGGMFCVWRQLLAYDGAVDRGKWVRSVYKKYKTSPGNFDFSKRPIKSTAETFQWRMENIVSPLCRCAISHRTRQMIKSKLISNGVSGKLFGDRA